MHEPELSFTQRPRGKQSLSVRTQHGAYSAGEEASGNLRGYDVGTFSAGFQPYALRIGGTATTATGPTEPMTIEKKTTGCSCAAYCCQFRRHQKEGEDMSVPPCSLCELAGAVARCRLWETCGRRPIQRTRYRYVLRKGEKSDAILESCLGCVEAV